jgi:hypothetical protein
LLIFEAKKEPKHLTTYEPMTTYHPPMTGLESQMEEEIANEAPLPNEALEKARQQFAQKSRTTPYRETAHDRKVEEAMPARPVAS